MSSNLKELEDKLRLGLEKAYQQMLEFKRQKKSPLVISKDGKIIKVPVE